MQCQMLKTKLRLLKISTYLHIVHLPFEIDHCTPGCVHTSLYSVMAFVGQVLAKRKAQYCHTVIFTYFHSVLAPSKAMEYYGYLYNYDDYLNLKSIFSQQMMYLASHNIFMQAIVHFILCILKTLF